MIDLKKSLKEKMITKILKSFFLTNILVILVIPSSFSQNWGGGNRASTVVVESPIKETLSTTKEIQGKVVSSLTSTISSVTNGIISMENIKVVPNPYVMTNMMEEAVTNPYLNQRRKLLFTHIPAECTIKIFTVSGVLVDEIKVQNQPEQGIVHWDMLTRESLEIAAGMYIYHVESVVTGDSKLGKFAVIK